MRIGVGAAAVAGVAIVGWFLVQAYILSPAEPAPPQLNLPADGAVLENGDVAKGTPIEWDFTWSEVPGAEDYQLMVERKHGAAPLINVTVDEPKYRHVERATSYSGDRIQGWTWKTRVRVGGCWSAWSDSRTFSVEPPVVKESEQKPVHFVIDGLRDQEHRNQVSRGVLRLRDYGAKNRSYSALGGRCWDRTDTYYEVGPISDIGAAADKIDFGRVLAVDPAERTIVVDASAKPAARPEKGWPGTEAIDQFVVRKTLEFAASRMFPNLIKKHGRKNVVVVMVPCVRRKDGWRFDDRIRNKLPRRPAVSVMESCGAPPITRFTLYHLSPMPDFEEVVTALDGEATLVVDRQRRVIVLGTAANLRPSNPHADE